MATYQEKGQKALSTKITVEQFDQISKMSKQLGFKSPYELLQTIAAILVKYDQNIYDAKEDSYRQICAFIEPFLEIEDFNAYTEAYLAEAEFGEESRNKKHSKIDYIVVRDGHLVSKFFRDEEGRMKIVHGADTILLDILKELRPWMHAVVLKAMKAMKVQSFIEWIRRSIIDQSEDIQGMNETAKTSMTSIMYGNVPKQKRNKTVEGFGNYTNTGVKRKKSESDYYSDYDEENLDLYEEDDPQIEDIDRT